MAQKNEFAKMSKNASFDTNTSKLKVITDRFIIVNASERSTFVDGDLI